MQYDSFFDNDEGTMLGNFDGIGKTSCSAKKKHSSESRQQGRAKKYMFDNLKKIKLDLEDGASEVTKIKGFIPKIGFIPVFVYYFSENGIRLWHGLAQRQPGFLAATGSVVKKNKTSGNKFMY